MKNKKQHKLQDQLSEIFSKLADRLGSPETEKTMKEYFRNVGKFHNYSPTNVLLIICTALERGMHIEKIASFKKWMEFKNEKGEKAHVLRGEKGLPVFVPVKVIQYERDDFGNLVFASNGEKIPLRNEEGEIVRRQAFKQGCVFDISQTNAREIGAFKDLAYRDMGKVIDQSVVSDISNRIVTHYGTKVNFDQVLRGNGNYDWISDEINISNSPVMPPANQLSTLFHELGHKILHGDKLRKSEISYVREHNQRGFIEGEAEAFGFALSSMYGIDNKSEFYLASWGNKPEDIKEKMQMISEAVTGAIKTLKLGESISLDQAVKKTQRKGQRIGM